MTTVPGVRAQGPIPADDNDPAAGEELGTLSGLRQSAKERVAIALIIAIPFLAILAAVPVAWGWGLGWRDIVIAVGMYAISGHGVTGGTSAQAGSAGTVPKSAGPTIDRKSVV